MKTQFARMMDGLNEVEAFLAGKQEGFKAHVPQDVDVKAIRNRLGMTQAKFSDTLGSASTRSSTGRAEDARSTSSYLAHRDRQKSRCSPQRTQSCCACRRVIEIHYCPRQGA